MNTLTVGGILGRSFSIWLRNFIPFTIVATIVHLPLIVYTFLVFDRPTTEGMAWWGRAMIVLPRVLGLVTTGAVTYGVFQQLRGQHASIGKSIGAGLQRFLPVVLVSLLVGAILIVGSLALLVPGIILTCMLYVAVPAAMIEHPGLIGALKRSADLTSGYKGTIFGMLFLLGVIQVVALMVIQALTMGSEPESMDEVTSYLITTGIYIVLAGTLQAVTSAVVYHDLRAIKEGVATEELAKVFD